MKKELLAICVFSLICGKSAFADGQEWVAGAFAASPGSGPQSESAILESKGGTVSYEFTFKNKKSSEAYLQYPMKADGVYSSLKFSACSAEKVCQMEVWLEGEDGWHFQEKVELKPSDWKDFTIPIVEVSPEKVKYVRMLFSPEGNPLSAKISVKDPVFSGKLNIDEKVDGLERTFNWSTLVWDDKDGKKRSTINIMKKNAPGSTGVTLNAAYDFPDEKCTQVVFKVPVKADCGNKKVYAECKGDNSGNRLEIWGVGRDGQNFCISSQDLDFNAGREIVSSEILAEAGYVEEIKFVIVKNRIGKGEISLDRIMISP